MYILEHNEKKDLTTTQVSFLRADLIGHGHPTLFGSQGLDDNALLGQPLKGHPCSILILFYNGILHS